MREVIYAMRFSGQAEAVGEVGNVFRTATRAPSSMLASTIGADGLVGVLIPAAGGEAACESELTMTGATSFQATGTIGFGNGHRVRFSTVGSGYLAPSADPGRKQGAAMCRVDRGEGQFEGASGLIASTFFIDEELGVVDHHFGVMLAPDAIGGR